MDFKKLVRYYDTLKYVKLLQIRYQFYYRLRTKWRKWTRFKYEFLLESSTQELNFDTSITAYPLYQKTDTGDRFTFLNLSHTFSDDDIDWNFADYGKLWTYNLAYFEYLHQKDMDPERGKALILQFIQKIETLKDALEPFPIALRGINWIKFLSMHAIRQTDIDNSLYAQYHILLDSIEYHLLGNHLLENGFSLLFGAYYFGDRHFFESAREILIGELQEQILPDGAHFELAPMYHQIMLYRVLDCYNLMKNNHVFEDSRLQDLLYEKASVMLGWLENITYENGNVPHLNDSTDGIAPVSMSLFAYAKRLDIASEVVPLKESGYRKYVTDTYELVVDVGNIGPDYIPGHAHSDTFNFELCIANTPWIVDTGISTYEANQRRLLERSTKAHNTVMVDNLEQSQVWSSFRVAKRAKIVALYESEHSIRATHDGYRDRGVLHTRQFETFSKQIKIKDILELEGRPSCEAVAYLHFVPEAEVSLGADNKIMTQKAIFSFKGLKRLEIVDITIAKGYNRLESSKGVKLYFERELETLIEMMV